MQQRTKEFFRGALAVLLVFVAAFGSFMVKDYLAMKKPQNALPELEVYYNKALLPQEHVEMASYDWRFMLAVTHGGKEDPDFWVGSIKAAPTNPNTLIKISFSFDCTAVKVSIFSENKYIISANDDTYVFVPVIGEIRTPAVSGEYTYRVEASWGWLEVLSIISKSWWFSSFVELYCGAAARRYQNISFLMSWRTFREKNKKTKHFGLAYSCSSTFHWWVCCCNFF